MCLIKIVSMSLMFDKPSMSLMFDKPEIISGLNDLLI